MRTSVFTAVSPWTTKTSWRPGSVASRHPGLETDARLPRSPEVFARAAEPFLQRDHRVDQAPSAPSHAISHAISVPLPAAGPGGAGRKVQRHLTTLSADLYRLLYLFDFEHPPPIPDTSSMSDSYLGAKPGSAPWAWIRMNRPEIRPCFSIRAWLIIHQGMIDLHDPGRLPEDPAT